MGDIVILETSTTLDIPVDRVLDSARDFDEVLVIGIKDGKVTYACSNSDKYQLYYLAQQFAHKLMWGDFD